MMTKVAMTACVATPGAICSKIAEMPPTNRPSRPAYASVSGALGFGLSWKRPARSLTLEARASIGRAFNDIGVVGGPLYLGTAVLGLELGTGTDDAFKAGLEIAGGAAFMTVADTSGTLMKTVPCLELGTSIGIPLGHGLFFCAGLRFMTVVDREITIMGISPAITVGTEL